ncbi:hypothetical protein ALC56_15308 [Trachymyrmex septentrionalis]|uniref:GIY-YIG domain-containing protein n=1 Tax=Trachymyrmex septentrionalis TaxID=34720 RepID=A0A195EQC7_9HYME|nr:hypothetical protein ALC56_15308 [Trachymyrmex septentrionalis]
MYSDYLHKAELMFGNKRFDVDDADNIIIDAGTSGLYELIFKRIPDDLLYTEDDINKYKSMLLATNAHKHKHHSQGRLLRNRRYKYKYVIADPVKREKLALRDDSLRNCTLRREEIFRRRVIVRGYDDLWQANVVEMRFEKGYTPNWITEHPLTQKKGTIFSLVDRAFLLSDVMFHTKNLTFIINILLDNDYPLNFNFDTVNQRIKNLIKNIYKVHNNLTDKVCANETASWLTVPYIPRHTEKFRRFNKNVIRVPFHSPNKMGKYIKVQKDICLHTSKSMNVVYKISCNNCDASYVGQMGRQLKSRITEHRNHIRHKTFVRSVITEHGLQCDHDFQWDNVKILDEEPCYRKRLISEMLL